MKHKIEKLYLDYFNNFVTLAGFASYYGIEPTKANRIIELGRKINNKKPKVN